MFKQKVVLLKYLIGICIVFFIIAVIFSACSWTTGGEEIIFPETNVSYMNHVQPFFMMNCSYAPCHYAGPEPASGYVLTEYHMVIRVPGFIMPGNPDGSTLVQILEGKFNPHIRRPIYTGNIKENQIKGIRTWIKEGAINN
jgi:hypothetical protein